MPASTSPARHCLALDLGAESGRAVLGSFDGARLALEELHRFPNTPVQLPDGLHWDILRLFTECKAGAARASQKAGGGLLSLGIDTWGVDFGLLDRRDALLGNPVHYRDSRTDGVMERTFRKMKREAIFEQTGIQFMQLNTLYQLLALQAQRSVQLEKAALLLMTPDLLNHWFSGSRVSERTIASTSQLYNPRKGDWARSVLGKLGLPGKIFPEIVDAGTVLGELRADVAAETGARSAKLVAPGCHDTACAVAAAPAETRDFAYLSSGTWSLLGVETEEPVITPECLKYNFTNEAGVCGTIRLLKNITGLWSVQECRRAWAAEGREYSYAELTALAEKAEPFAALVNPDYAEFFKPGTMPEKVVQFCKSTDQAAPQTPGGLVRALLEGLALKYRMTLEQVEELTGMRRAALHIVGGGSRNKLLNRMAADCLGRLVVAGPVEATAAGNVLMQLLAAGELDTLAEGRALVRRSFEMETVEPRAEEKARWDEAYGKFKELTAEK